MPSEIKIDRVIAPFFERHIQDTDRVKFTVPGEVIQAIWKEQPSWLMKRPQIVDDYLHLYVVAPSGKVLELTSHEDDQDTDRLLYLEPEERENIGYQTLKYEWTCDGTETQTIQSFDLAGEPLAFECPA